MYLKSFNENKKMHKTYFNGFWHISVLQLQYWQHCILLTRKVHIYDFAHFTHLDNMGSSPGKFYSVIFGVIYSSSSSSISQQYSRGLISIFSMNVECNPICVYMYARLICSNTLDDVAGSFSRSSSFDFL